MHPCCGGSLQSGTRMVAIFEMVMAIISLILIGFLLIGGVVLSVAAADLIKNNGVKIKVQNDNSEISINGYTNSSARYNQNEKLDDADKAILTGVAVLTVIISVLGLIFGVISLVMAVILLKGSNQRNRSKCRIWLIYRVITWCLSIVSLFGRFYPSLMTILVTPYFMWVVHSFIKELEGIGPGVSPAVIGNGMPAPTAPPPPYAYNGQYGEMQMHQQPAPGVYIQQVAEPHGLKL